MILPETSQPATVAIVAAGVVSPLGRGLDANVAGLRKGRDCVTRVTAFDVGTARCHDAGQVPDPWLEPLRDSRRARKLHRASLMMISAMRELRGQDAGFAPEQMIIGATGGGMTFGEACFRSIASRGADRRRAAWLANYNPQKAVQQTDAQIRYDQQQAALSNQAPAAPAAPTNQ